MPLKFRRAFFYFYVGLFLIFAPLVVLYTAGFRFNFHTLRLAQVGALSVTSLPKGATIWLDGQALTARTPMLAKRTLPGTYTLKLTREGYTPWERQIDVKSRETTLIDAATLFLQTTPKQLQTLDPIASTATHDGAFLVYILKSDPWLELWSQNVSNGQLTLLDRLSAKTLIDPQLHFTHDDYLLILDDVTSDTRRYYTTSGALSETPSWFAAYHFSHQDDAEILSKTLSESSISSIARLSEGSYRIDDVFDNVLLVRDTTRNHFLLIDTQTSGPPILLNSLADWANFSGDQLYLSDGFELHRYDMQTNTDTLITRSSTPVTSVVPYLSAQTLFVVNPTTVVATDISDMSHPVNTTLFSADAVQTFWMDRRGKFGYALATVNGVHGLYQIALAK